MINKNFKFIKNSIKKTQPAVNSIYFLDRYRQTRPSFFYTNNVAKLIKKNRKFGLDTSYLNYYLNKKVYTSLVLKDIDFFKEVVYHRISSKKDSTRKFNKLVFNRLKPYVRFKKFIHNELASLNGFKSFLSSRTSHTDFKLALYYYTRYKSSMFYRNSLSLSSFKLYFLNQNPYNVINSFSETYTLFNSFKKDIYNLNFNSSEKTKFLYNKRILKSYLITNNDNDFKQKSINNIFLDINNLNNLNVETISNFIKTNKDYNLSKITISLYKLIVIFEKKVYKLSRLTLNKNNKFLKAFLINAKISYYFSSKLFSLIKKTFSFENVKHIIFKFKNLINILKRIRIRIKRINSYACRLQEKTLTKSTLKIRKSFLFSKKVLK